MGHLVTESSTLYIDDNVCGPTRDDSGNVYSSLTANGILDYLLIGDACLYNRPSLQMVYLMTYFTRTVSASKAEGDS